jgi:hypothetical protein
MQLLTYLNQNKKLPNLINVLRIKYIIVILFDVFSFT